MRRSLFSSLMLLFLHSITGNRESRSKSDEDTLSLFFTTKQPDLMSTPSGIEANSRRVGKSCTFHSDCVQGAFCDKRFCRCWANYVHISSYCWKKINPDESGCTHDQQCEAVWPGAFCSPSGVCKCANGQKVSPTREGSVCHPLGECPTNGVNGVLYVRNSNRQAECYFFDRHGQELPGHFMGCEDAPELFDCIGGMCCPSRAFTCIQPMDPGEKSEDERELPTKRWFYNTATGNCHRFEYLGKKGNSNHFLTRDHCTSYCKSRCSRGQPLLEEPKAEISDEVPGALVENLVIQCSSNQDCRYDKFECTKVQLQSICCPSAEYICSEYGGLGGLTADLKKRPLQSPFNAGVSRFGQEPTSRWGWDRTARKCRLFQYRLQGGDFNNFLTEADCLQYCSVSLCPVGSPLRVDSGSNAECENQHQCPRTHTCINTVCCPTAATVCNLPLLLGSACHAEPVTRYWYNAEQETCHVFQYLGCGGNANSFESLSACQDFCSFNQEEPTCPHGDAIRLDDGRFWKCDHRGGKSEEEACPIHFVCHYNGKIAGCCPEQEYTCGLPPDSGRVCGGGQVTRWYFDSLIKMCKSFDFNGCEGNSNRFPSQKECEDYCGVQDSCPYGGQLLMDNSTNQPMTCGPNSTTQCPQTHSCVRMSGHGSLVTHFCCLNRFSICSLPISEGETAGEPSIRFAFDPESRQCKPFLFKGTKGNENNHMSAQSCINFCTAAACAAGEIIYRTRPTDNPFDCSRAACPEGFICVVDVTNTERSVCCGTLNMGLCPEGQGVFVEERSQKPLTSNGNSNECPLGYFGVYNEERKRFFCCSPNDYKKLQCPNGLEASKNLQTQEAMGCNYDSQCLPGARCNANGERTGICCNRGPPCPPTFSLDIERSKKPCDPLKSPTCGDSLSVCLHSEILERFVCCKRGARPHQELTQCPGTMIQDPNRHQCSVSDLCPPSFHCIRRMHDRIGVCCRHRRSLVITTPLECPDGSTPYKNLNGEFKVCNDNAACPPPYKCHLSSSAGSRSRLCCLEPPPKVARCPHNLLPLSADGIQQSCANGASACPSGYRCSDDICCPKPEFACSVPFFAGVKCKGAKPTQRWYFHSQTGRCQPFTFRGCTPSANNFPDVHTCLKNCVSTESMSGKSQCSFPYANPAESSSAQPCTDEGGSGCEEGERCVINAYGRLVCCILQEGGLFDRLASSADDSFELSLQSTSFCGPRFVPLLDQYEHPVPCHPFSSPCDRQQICQYAQILNGYVCCIRQSILFGSRSRIDDYSLQMD